ncbi:hypothetical protein GCM10011609_50860 [Lentzea pudingi]|uniref:Uncharacterized protein n=1 Tax=Lentzea pudingi TaxID=1789439 RepID=A0ABQ2IDT4_9PSEU|nr:hypothetical protein GCM10011609_50860 [Lentzea pudingi]
MLGADDDEIGLPLLREAGDGLSVGHVHTADLGVPGYACVARRARQGRQLRVARQREDKGMLTGSRPDDQDAHEA